MSAAWPVVRFADVMRPCPRPYTLGPNEDAHLVGMQWYGGGPFHRELKAALQIAKKSHFVITTGDVLYNKLFAWKGAFGVVPPELDGMFVSDKFPTYELDRTRVDEGYLRCHFRHPRLWEQAQAMSTGSAAVSKLTLNPPKFLLLTIPLPPLEEQRRIVARVEGTETLTKAATAASADAHAAAKALRGSVLHRLSSRLAPLGTLERVLQGPPRNGWSARCDGVEGGTPVLSLAAVTGFQYRASEHKLTSLDARTDGHFWLRPGDLLITRSNTPELVGHAAIYDGHPSPCIYPDLMMRLDVRPDAAEPRFVWYWLQSPLARNFITRNAKGTSPTMKKISQEVVKGIPFPTSLGLAAQVRIVEMLDGITEKVDATLKLQASVAAELNAIMPSLLQRVLD